MTPSQIHAHLARIAESIARLDELDLSKLGDKRTAATIVARAGGRTVIKDAFVEAHRRCTDLAGIGYPSNTRPDPTGRSTGHGTSPTERAAERHDDFDSDRRLIEQTVRRIRRDLVDLERFMVRHLAPTADASTVLFDDCASCLRVDQHTPPVHTPRSIEGVPVKPLCNWCYVFALTYQCWPPTELLEKHHACQRISAREVSAALAAMATSSFRPGDTPTARKAVVETEQAGEAVRSSSGR